MTPERLFGACVVIAALLVAAFLLGRVTKPHSAHCHAYAEGLTCVYQQPGPSS